MGMPLTKHRFTIDQYHRMGEAGVFHYDDRVELIDGEIVEMSPIGPDHSSCVMRLTTLFAPLARRATLSVQNPVILGEYHEPQPDFAVLRYRADGYKAGHPQPGDMLLIVEVGDSTVDRDRETKIPLYADARIPETWLVNIPGDVIEVYREPGPAGYRDVRRVLRGGTVTVLQLPGVTLPADEVLGPRG